jgi:hypothetical protein
VGKVSGAIFIAHSSLHEHTLAVSIKASIFLYAETISGKQTLGV